MRTASLMLAVVLVTGLAVSAASAEVTLIPVVDTRADEWGPVAGSGGIAWNRYNRRDSWVLARVNADTFRVNSSRTSAWTGSIEGDTLVYQRANRRGSDIVAFDLSSRSKLPSPAYVNTRWWEWGPRASGDWVFFGRSNVNYGQRREWRKLILTNTATGESRRLAMSPRRGYQQLGQVSGNWVTWYECSDDSWADCSMYRYDIAGSVKELIPQVTPAQWDPAISSDGTLYYLRGGRACGKNVTLVRRTLDGTESVLYEFPASIDAGGLYVDDGPTQDDLYFHDIACEHGFASDIYKISAADTAAPVIVRSPASGIRTPGQRRSGSPQMSRPEPSRPPSR